LPASTEQMLVYHRVRKAIHRAAELMKA